MIDTVVIPAAGLGTRLLTGTKETPKEMMPLFNRVNGIIVTQPLIERIFLQLFNAGIRNFYIVVGKNKRTIEDHFTPDNYYIEALRGTSNEFFRSLLRDFHKKIEQSNIVWINQNSPKGFGAAVLIAKNVIDNRPFLVHAGDAFVKGGSEYITRLIRAHSRNKSSITLYLHEIINPKAYGVAEARKIGRNTLKVIGVEEKPKQPKSNYALMPVYLFEPKIFDALSLIKPGLRNELQLTDAIQQIIEWNYPVYAIKFPRANDCIDIGTPENYFRSLRVSFNDSKSR